MLCSQKPNGKSLDHTCYGPDDLSLFRLKKGIQEISERFKKEQQLLNELNAKAKQIKEALSTA